MKSHKHAIVQYEEDRNPGCMWGILQSLRFYRWHKLKIGKQSPSKVSRIARLNMGDSMKEREPLVAKADESLAEPRPTKTAPAKRKSRQTRIRALVAEEMSKQESHENMQISDAQLKHSSSIYPLEAPNHCLGKINSGWGQTALVLDGKTGASTPKLQDPPPYHNKQNEPYEQHVPGKGKKARNLEIQRHEEANQLGKDLSHSQYRECTNAVGILKVSSELFSKLVQEPEDHSTETHTEMRLSRSGSYPVVKPSSRRIIVSSNLEHKQTEIWATRSMQLMADDKIGSRRSHSMDVSSHCSPYQSFQNQFEDDKRNAKHALKTNRRERNRITMETLHWNPHGPWLSADDKVNKAGSAVKDKQNHFKRASSLNESMDRYAQLLEHSFNKDYILPKSKSLRLTNEDEFGCGRSAPKSLRKNHSVQNLESCHSLQNEVCTEAPDSGLQSITSVDNNKYMAGDSEDDFSPRASHDLRGDMIEPEVQEGISHCGRKVGSTEITRTGPAEPVLQTTSCDGDLTKPLELEGLEFKPGCCDLEGLDSDVNPERTSIENITSEASISLVNPENVGDTGSKNEVAKHTYEKETSGFSGAKFPKLTCDSPGHPLDPSALEEVLQAYLIRESADISKEPGEGSCDRKIQSDLGNEALLKMLERSSVHWPRALSCSCHIPPMPTWNHILEEVRVSTRHTLRPRQELWGQWLDSAVSRDMTRDANDWMNLQFESENVGLELEDLIFCQLLEDTLLS